jgi:hypothetical protein
MLSTPLLSYPIRGDDSYWIMEVPGETGSSLVGAVVEPFRDAYALQGQPRITPLAFAERRVVAVGVMFIADVLAVEPKVLWGWLKVLLAGIIGFSILVFMRSFRFRAAGGQSSRLSSRARWITIVAAPLIVSAGVELETYGLSNAWLFYPTLTWLPIAHALFTASLLIWLSRSMSSWPAWAGVLGTGLVAGIGVLFAVHYELLIVVVLFAILALALQPPNRPGGHRWDTPRIAIASAFLFGFGAVFLFNRWWISRNPCFAAGDCYAGTVIDGDPAIVWANVTTALPGFGFAYISENLELGGPPPSLAIAIAIALLAAVATVVLLRQAPRLKGHSEAASDARGAAIIAMLMIGLGLATAAITGVTAGASTVLESMQSPYRTGVVTWVSLSVSLALVLVIADALRPGSRAARLGLGSLALVSVSLTAGSQMWANTQTFREQIVTNASAEIDAFHREVALGDLSNRGDRRRCEIYERWDTIFDEPGATAQRVASAADAAFRTMHGEQFCSDGIPEGFER